VHPAPWTFASTLRRAACPLEGDVAKTTIEEPGNGDTPVDIVRFRNPMDGTDDVLVTDTNRSAKQVALSAVASASRSSTARS